jgi:hypothetical protein
MRVLAIGGKPVSVDGKLIAPPDSTDIITQEKSINITKNGSYEVSRDSGKYLTKVSITAALPTEQWTFELSDGSTVTKNVVVDSMG